MRSASLATGLSSSGNADLVLLVFSSSSLVLGPDPVSQDRGAGRVAPPRSPPPEAFRSRGRIARFRWSLASNAAFRLRRALYAILRLPATEPTT